jgi:hypothetical protein
MIFDFMACPICRPACTGDEDLQVYLRFFRRLYQPNAKGDDSLMKKMTPLIDDKEEEEEEEGYQLLCAGSSIDKLIKIQLNLPCVFHIKHVEHNAC